MATPTKDTDDLPSETETLSPTPEATSRHNIASPRAALPLRSISRTPKTPARSDWLPSTASGFKVGPTPKNKRQPSAYNLFMKNELWKVRKESPQLTRQECFAAAAHNVKIICKPFPNIYSGRIPQVIQRALANLNLMNLILLIDIDPSLKVHGLAIFRLIIPHNRQLFLYKVIRDRLLPWHYFSFRKNILSPKWHLITAIVSTLSRRMFT